VAALLTAVKETALAPGGAVSLGGFPVLVFFLLFLINLRK
jgi:hypothetical protein